ncbi:MAG: N-acetylglucosaminyldiphosphoundecaprenol N-acetyl-beta-D-mannosaminyltransferase [Thermomicrobiales bacterium]|nr:N-acetylglucosaminyldiphosphoundecaprenol N-acetyl-beta-D-mannosaminyltransferase [Thermomicrobiales bacterium]
MVGAVVPRAVAVAASADPRGGGRAGRLSVLGVPLDVVGAAEAKEALRTFLAEPWDGCCRHVVTLNPEYVMAARRNAEFAMGIAKGDLITADGVGVVIAARMLGGSEGAGVERVTGVNLVDWIAEMSGPVEVPVFLLGGRSRVTEEAARRLSRRFPGARIAGWWSEGTPSPAHDAEALARIRASGARAVVVAYGALGQVAWIERNRQELAAAGVRVAVGVGGVLDFLAGTVPRAPTVVRRAGLEWLYRLIREPWRWRRQAVLPVFGLRVLLEKLWRRGNRAGKIARPKSS